MTWSCGRIFVRSRASIKSSLVDTLKDKHAASDEAPSALGRGHLVAGFTTVALPQVVERI